MGKVVKFPRANEEQAYATARRLLNLGWTVETIPPVSP